jgi:phosphosulfolactate synthase
LRTSAAYIDLAKIAVGIGALLPFGVLGEKLRSYREHHVTPFPGGQFLEHAVLHHMTEEYLRAVVEAGFDCVEVSDNLLDIPLERKLALIRLARETYRLHVLGEVGKKAGLESSVDPAEDAAACLDAGAEVVFLEAADFFAGEVDEEKLDRIIERCELDRLVFELPGPWIKGVTSSDVHEATCWLLDRFGPETNIANVDPDHVLKLEAQRLGIGTNAGRK